MASENVDIVRRGFEHFASTGEVPMDLLTPDFVWDMSHLSGWPEQQTYEGLDGTRAFLRDWSEAWDDWRLDVLEMQAADDQVLVTVHQSGRSKATGMPLEMTFAQLFTIRDGRQSRMDMYSDLAEARRAAGLS